MANPTTVVDLEERWRPLSDAEALVATSLLGDAWALLTARLPSLEDNMAAGTVTTTNVVRVVSAMVLRVMRNPDGKLEESIDDYRYRRDSLVSSGVLHVTADELSDLIPGVRRRVSGVRLVVNGER